MHEVFNDFHSLLRSLVSAKRFRMIPTTKPTISWSVVSGELADRFYMIHRLYSQRNAASELERRSNSDIVCKMNRQIVPLGHAHDLFIGWDFKHLLAERVK